MDPIPSHPSFSMFPSFLVNLFFTSTTASPSLNLAMSAVFSCLFGQHSQEKAFVNEIISLLATISPSS